MSNVIKGPWEPQQTPLEKLYGDFGVELPEEPEATEWVRDRASESETARKANDLIDAFMLGAVDEKLL